MADLNIQKDFIEGIYEIYSTMFNDGVNDGIYLYTYINDVDDLYGEDKYRKFSKPKLLVAKANLYPEQPEEYIEEVKDIVHFIVPYKSLLDNGIGVTSKELRELRKSYIYFDGMFYDIVVIKPLAYVENVFLTYDFTCLPNLDYKSMYVVDDEYEEEVSLNYDESANDR